MTDQKHGDLNREEILDHTLSNAYSSPPLLDPSFEREIMQRLRDEAAGGRARHGIAAIMTVYWAVAGIITCMLMGGGVRHLVSGETPGMNGVLLCGLVTLIALVALARVADVRISQLLFRTFARD